MSPTLLVLAAGMGSRYGGLKQIAPVGPSGETIIDYSIFDAIRAGFGKVVFVIRKEIEADFKEVFLRKLEKHLPTEYVFQELEMLPAGFSVPEGRTKPWGTAHAILTAKQVVNEPFAVINGDDYYGVGAFAAMAAYLNGLTPETQAHFAMVGYHLQKTMSQYGSVSRGVCQTDATGFLQKVVERTKIQFTGDGKVADLQENQPPLYLAEDSIVSMNFWGFTPAYFQLTEQLFIRFLQEKGQELKSEFYIPFAVDELIQTQQAKVKVLRSPDQWFGITYSEDRPTVVDSLKALHDRGIYPERLFGGKVKGEG